MSSHLNKIVSGALKNTSLKRIRFKRDPGNLESSESYEGYLLEEDGVSRTATIFIPSLGDDNLMNVGMDSIEMIEPVKTSNICSLKLAAVKSLMNGGDITAEVDLAQFDRIETIEQLEFYLMQFDLCDSKLLNIYRTSFIDESI